MLKIEALEKLIHEFSRLPGIGPKTAQRLAYYILKSSDEYSIQLSQALVRVKEEVHICPQCYNYTDRDLCKFCEDIYRQDESLCIVEEPSGIMRIEASGVYRGRYHVLHGAISPLEGIGPEQLKIKELIDRIHKLLSEENPKLREIILALDSDLEGDTTVLYLSKFLKDKNLKITRIAHGIPIGSDIEYIDDRTMSRALENRIEL